MNISEAGIDLIKGFEGCVLHPYLDGRSIPTIGIGNTYYPDGRKVTMQDPPITEDQAIEYLNSALSDTISYLNNALLTAHLTQHQFDALCSLTYNIGSGHFQTSTVRRLVNGNPQDPGILAAFEMWCKENVDGQLITSPGLLNRRTQEAAFYFS